MATTSSSTQSSQSDAKSGSCKEHTLRVENQRQEGQCIFIHMADMAGTTIRMVENTPDKPKLSHQPLADKHLTENFKVANFITNPKLGLETTDTYPNESQSRLYHEWCDKKYRERCQPRYYLSKIRTASNPVQIEVQLKKHFLGEDAPKFPIVADIVTGGLGDFEAAAKRVTSGEVYRHAESLNHKKPDHSVLVVGIDISSQESKDHYAEIKNCWGKTYGEEGFTKVGFEIFRKIWWPAPKEEGGALYGIMQNTPGSG